MRAQKQLVFYGSILDTLLESGCPFCRFLKDFQAKQLQYRSECEIRTLCNFHAWGLAAVQDAVAAAQIFINLMETAKVANNCQTRCDLCQQISIEEDRRIREFVDCVHRENVADWLREVAVFCIPHGAKLRRHAQPVMAARVDAILEHQRRQLKEELETLRSSPKSDRPGWGVLGRAAEFLVSQRGLHL